VHLFISLLLRGSIISKCSLKMSGKVREFDHDWRVATLRVPDNWYVDVNEAGKVCLTDALPRLILVGGFDPPTH